MRRLLPLLACACAAPDPDDARRAWLVERLTEANAVWLARDPARVEEQYAKMAADPYDFLRGTNAVFAADLARPDPDRPPTSFLIRPEAASILVVGDPHLENLGTCLPGPEPDSRDADPDAALWLEWVDLDAAARGPWTVDTRRAAQSMALLAGDDADVVVEAFARAYAAEALAPSWDPGADDPDAGRWVEELREDARRDGISSVALAEITTTADGPRRFVPAELDDAGEGYVRLDPDEARLVELLLGRWPARPAGFRVLDAIRQYGKGVASFAAPRFLVAWDLGDDAPHDDRLLQIREVVDPPRQPGAPVPLPPGVERIEAATALWSRRDVDVLYAGVGDGLGVYKLSTVSGWFLTPSHEDAAEVSDHDLDGMAATLGRALARAHGADVRADLAAGGGEESLVAERVRDARRDRARLLRDHGLFLEALDALGPLLGADGIDPR